MQSKIPGGGIFYRYLHLICGFVLLSCVVLWWYNWEGHDGTLLYERFLMRCYTERKMSLLDSLRTIWPHRMHYQQPQLLKPQRNDVLVMTPWLAPIIWEGTYDLKMLDKQFKQRNISIGLTVFAIKKYVVFLNSFLKSAEKHFMIGYRVNYYIFTDQMEAIPKIKLRKRRKLVPLKVQNYVRWQDISMRRMEMIRNLSRQQFIHEVDYLVCVDVDMTFEYRVGVEILSELFGTLHPTYYSSERDTFAYERRPDSQAYIPEGLGDFYYAGGFFGGTVAKVYKLTQECHKAIMVDKRKSLEAVWHDESHLNKYFLYHKPTKILSPEYLWDNDIRSPEFQMKKRFLAIWKNHTIIRSKRRATMT